jgi:hypothetical protein
MHVEGERIDSAVRSYALDPAGARSLWTRSEEWARARFSIGE